MTLHYPETEAAPPSYAAPPAETITEDVVPVYARKAPKRSSKKMLLWAVPAVLALGVGAWAMTLGQQKSDETTLADTEGLTTSRLSATQTEAPVVAEPLAVQSTPAPDAVAPAAAPSLRQAPAPVRVTTTTTTRRTVEPARRAAPARAPVVTTARPLPQETLAPVVIVTTPAPPSVAPIPVLPTEPAPQVTPPATATPPGPGS